MTKQYSDTMRNAILTPYEATLGTSPKCRIYTGTQPATVATSASGTQLWEGSASSDWLTSPSSGTASLIGTFSGTVSVDGTAGYYRLLTSGGTAHEQGSITRAFSLSTSASTSAGSNVLTFTSTTGVVDGQAISGTGVPSGAVVLSHTSTTVTMSGASSAGVSSSTAIYFGDTSGDLWLNSTALTASQVLTITVLTRTAPGA